MKNDSPIGDGAEALIEFDIKLGQGSRLYVCLVFTIPPPHIRSAPPFTQGRLNAQLEKYIILRRGLALYFRSRVSRAFTF